MAEQHGTYYVPDHSIWPIVGTLGLFGFAVGSLNFSSLWGMIVFSLGALTLLVMLFGWMHDVVRESGADLYDAQMGRTFRWGMFWLLLGETFFFGTALGALIYVRFASLPWMAGTGSGGSIMTHYVLWPNFQNTWPLLVGPNPNAFPLPKMTPTAWGLPLLNTLILLMSAITAIFSWRALLTKKQQLAIAGMSVTLLLGLAFLVSQVYFLFQLATKYGVTIASGIYGSLFYFLNTFHLIHIVVGLILFAVILLLTIKNHFNAERTFGFSASVLFWSFLTVIWLFIFVCVYWV